MRAVMRFVASFILCVLILGCRGPKAHASYKVESSPELDRATVETVVHLALSTSEAKQHPERFDRVRVVSASSTDQKQGIRVELVGYMDGYIVHLTNSVSGWSIASVGRVIE
jgi:hypothetical protein